MARDDDNYSSSSDEELLPSLPIRNPQETRAYNMRMIARAVEGLDRVKKVRISRSTRSRMAHLKAIRILTLFLRPLAPWRYCGL